MIAIARFGGEHEVETDEAFQLFGEVDSLGEAKQRYHGEVDAVVVFGVFFEKSRLEGLFEWAPHCNKWYFYCVCRWGSCGGWGCCWRFCTLLAKWTLLYLHSCASARWWAPRYRLVVHRKEIPRLCSTAWCLLTCQKCWEGLWGRSTRRMAGRGNRGRR